MIQAVICLSVSVCDDPQLQMSLDLSKYLVQYPVEKWKSFQLGKGSFIFYDYSFIFSCLTSGDQQHQSHINQTAKG